MCTTVRGAPLTVEPGRPLPRAICEECRCPRAPGPRLLPLLPGRQRGAYLKVAAGRFAQVATQAHSQDATVRIARPLEKRRSEHGRLTADLSHTSPRCLSRLCSVLATRMRDDLIHDGRGGSLIISVLRIGALLIASRATSLAGTWRRGYSPACASGCSGMAVRTVARRALVDPAAMSGATSRPPSDRTVCTWPRGCCSDRRARSRTPRD